MGSLSTNLLATLHVFFYKKQGDKKHEAQIRQKLGNTGRVRCKSKPEKPVFARKFLIELEKNRNNTRLSNDFLTYTSISRSIAVLLLYAIGNFKDFKKHLQI